MNIFVISILFFGFCALFFSALIYFKRRDSVGALWLCFSTCCAIWSLGYAFQINNEVPYATALFMTRVGDAAAIFIPVFWLHFVSLFLQRRLPRAVWAGLYGISGILLLTAPTEYFIKGLKDKSHIGMIHFADGGIAFYVYSAVFAAVVLIGFVLLLKAYGMRNASKEKQQIFYLTFGTALAFLGGGTAFLPVFDIDLQVLYGTLLSPFFVIFIGAAFLRHNLLDIDSIAMAMHQEKLMEMGILSASINHELKSPLYVIKTRAESFLERRKEGTLNDPQIMAQVSEENFKIVQEQSQRMFHIMSRLKTFITRKAEDKPVKTLTKVSDILDQLQPLLGHHLMTQNIELVCDLHPDAGEVVTDAGYLEEILFNLLVNASQALHHKVPVVIPEMFNRGSTTPDQQPGFPLNNCGNDSKLGKIIVRTRREPGKVLIEVEDNGPGIPPELLKRIFQPFYTTKEQGVGLGLYITQRLAERINAKLTASNVAAGGARFTLEFSA